MKLEWFKVDHEILGIRVLLDGSNPTKAGCYGVFSKNAMKWRNLGTSMVTNYGEPMPWGSKEHQEKIRQALKRSLPSQWNLKYLMLNDNSELTSPYQIIMMKKPDFISDQSYQSVLLHAQDFLANALSRWFFNDNSHPVFDGVPRFQQEKMSDLLEKGWVWSDEQQEETTTSVSVVSAPGLLDSILNENVGSGLRIAQMQEKDHGVIEFDTEIGAQAYCALAHQNRVLLSEDEGRSDSLLICRTEGGIFGAKSFKGRTQMLRTAKSQSYWHALQDHGVQEVILWDWGLEDAQEPNGKNGSKGIRVSVYAIEHAIEKAETIKGMMTLVGNDDALNATALQHWVRFKKWMMHELVQTAEHWTQGLPSHIGAMEALDWVIEQVERIEQSSTAYWGGDLADCVEQLQTLAWNQIAAVEATRDQSECLAWIEKPMLEVLQSAAQAKGLRQELDEIKGEGKDRPAKKHLKL